MRISGEPDFCLNHFNAVHERFAVRDIAHWPRLACTPPVAIEMCRQKARDLELAQGESDGNITADPNMGYRPRDTGEIAPTELTILIQGETGTGKGTPGSGHLPP